MGCLLSCLGIRDDYFSFLQPLPQSTENMTVSQDRSALLLHEGNDCYEEKGRNALKPPRIQIITKELKDEAMFLKACGTIPSTPPEIRKANKEINCLVPHTGDYETSEFNSWLPISLTQKLPLIKEHVLPVLPIKQCEEWREELASSKLTPISCITDTQNTAENSISPIEENQVKTRGLSKIHPNQSDKILTPISSWLSNKTAQHGSKSVRFTCNLDADSLSSCSSSSSKYSQNMKNFELLADLSVSKSSPYPTPRKLTEEMQTPGTVFPGNLNDVTNGKPARIRSQYVHSQKSVENLSTWMAMKEGHDVYHSGEKITIVNPVQEAASQQTSREDFELEASMSDWLKTRLSDSDHYNLTAEETSNVTFNFERNHGDWPVLAAAANQPKEDEPTPLLPKWWDGNGIPNTTSKFKEDQKVIWHGTPFEERLEKALSEGSFVSQRNRVSEKPVAYNDDEENNTAKSQLCSLARAEPVVSF